MPEKKILIVDDNPDDVMLVARYLKRGDFSVFTADNVSEGIALAQKEDVSCMLIDYRMPQRNGIDMVRIIKADPKLKYIPIIMLTGLEEEKHVLEGLAAGADDYVGKSSSADIILARVRALLRVKELQDDIKTANVQLQSINSKLSDANLAKEKALEQLNEAVVKLRDISIHDNLTGLHNHGYFIEIMNKEFLRAKRYNQNMCCLMIDLDYFKTINDTYGHMFGDKVLQQLSECLKNGIREVDFLARYGGEEFVVLLFNTDYEGARVVAERLRETVGRHKFSDRINSINLTVSVGISSLFEDEVLEQEKFLSFADQALYEAKTKGRNMVILYREIVKGKQSRNTKLKDIENKIYGIAGSSKQSYVEAIKALIVAHEAKDMYTREHSINVMRYSSLLAEEMQLPPNECEIINNASILHDLGKIGIPDNILLKKDKLTAEEYNVIKKHPLIAVHILQSSHYVRRELQIILHHHERFDGKGYPEGLKGEEIPLGSRIIAVADSYDAMRTDRPYRSALPMAFIISELVNNSGTQFDPKIVLHFLQALVKQQLIPPEINIQDGLEMVKAKIGSQRLNLSE